MPYNKAVSYSGLSLYRQCPLRWYDAYVLGNRQPSGAAADRGTYIHELLEDYFNGKTPYPSGNAVLKKWTSQITALMAHNPVAEGEVAVSKDWAPVSFSDPLAYIRGKVDLTYQAAAHTINDWKGLCVETLLPTPTGWTTMGEVQVGQEVISGAGLPCKVVGKSEVHDRRCFRLTFDDQSSVVCDDQHLWTLLDGSVVDTLEVALRKEVGGHVRMPTTEPVDLEAVELPIDPYTLGVWLGDGKHTSGEVCKPDADLWDTLCRRGERIGGDISSGRVRTHTILGLRTKLRVAGLLGNKHIPAAYFRASRRQREDLVRGLMDSDGYANPTRKQCGFASKSEDLAHGVAELLLSLGQRPNVSTCRGRGFGKEITYYQVFFRPVHGFAPFYLPRKADKVGDWGPGHSTRRYVTEVLEVPSVPTQCIAVDSPCSTYLCTDRWIVTHNTGKKYPTHGDQGKVYVAISAPHEDYTVNMWYLDDPHVIVSWDYTFKDREQIIVELVDEVEALRSATEYPATPGDGCQWCHLSWRNGGDCKRAR